MHHTKLLYYCYSPCAVCYILVTYLLYTEICLEFVPPDPLHQFCSFPQPLLSGNYWFVLCVCESVSVLLYFFYMFSLICAVMVFSKVKFGNDYRHTVYGFINFKTWTKRSDRKSNLESVVPY